MLCLVEVLGAADQSSKIQACMEKTVNEPCSRTEVETADRLEFGVLEGFFHYTFKEAQGSIWLSGEGKGAAAGSVASAFR